MSSWTPVWHQAMTRMLFDGKMVGRKKTAGFTFPIYASGTAVRVRLSSLFGKEAALIGSLTFVYKHQVYDLTYNGEKFFRISAGEQILTDAFNIHVEKATEAEIRIYYENSIIDGNMIEEGAVVMSGNHTHDAQLIQKKSIIAQKIGSYNPVPAIERIEVLSEEEHEVIVAFGDSITSMNRYCKPLNRRLYREYDGKYLLMNSGISGNCLLYEPDSFFGIMFGDKGVTRFERDVLDFEHLKSVILALGVNDVSYYDEKTKDIINLENYKAAITDIVNELHKRGIRVIMTTITPRLKVARTMGVFTKEMEEQRLLFNEWIRSADIFDDLVDQEEAVRDYDAEGMFFKEGLHQGDHLHPNHLGGSVMADNFDLKKLTGE